LNYFSNYNILISRYTYRFLGERFRSQYMASQVNALYVTHWSIDSNGFKSLFCNSRILSTQPFARFSYYAALCIRKNDCNN